MASSAQVTELPRQILRVVIVDDSAATRTMLQDVISGQAGYQAVGLAGSAQEAVALVEATSPDIVIIDLCMPYIGGSKLLSMLQNYPHLHKVILSANDSASGGIRKRLIELGASAVFDKAVVARDPATFRDDLRKIAKHATVGPKSDGAGPAIRSESNVIFAAGRFPLPRDEQARLRALAAMGVANLAVDPCLDIIVRHLAAVTAYPIVAINLIDADRVWAKAAVGIERQVFQREHSICTHVLCQDGPLTVSDATAHPIFGKLPAVTGGRRLRAYIGAPIVAQDGVTLGVVCAFDDRPRHASRAEIGTIADAAKLVAAFLENPVRPARCVA